MAVSEKKRAANARWDKENMTLVSVKVRNTLKEEFRAVCEQNGTTMNAVLLKALHDYMGEAEQPSSPAPLPLPSGWEQTPPSVLRTLRTPDGWQLDVDDDGRAYGAWLSHPSCSVKAFLAGADKSKHTLDEFTALILNEIQLHIRNYKRDYMD